MSAIVCYNINIMNNKLVGQKIKNHMASQSIKPYKLSQMTGLHRDTIYKILRGDRGMTLESVEKIANALGIAISVLVD